MQSYKEAQDEEKQKLLDDISSKLTEEDLNCPVLIFDATGLVDNPEIIGLTAMNLASKYKRPVILGSIKDSNKTNITGSVRLNNGFPDQEFKETCLDSGLFGFAQGHNAAFGFAYNKDNKHKIQEYFISKYGKEKLQNEHTVDFIISNINDIAPFPFHHTGQQFLCPIRFLFNSDL